MEQTVEYVTEIGVVTTKIDYPLARFEFIGTLHMIH